jgi:transcriptional accessory protein Tex/SPT6
VDESGASIYSVSDEAKKELPSLDPSLRGAGMIHD